MSLLRQLSLLLCATACTACTLLQELNGHTTTGSSTPGTSSAPQSASQPPSLPAPNGSTLQLLTLVQQWHGRSAGDQANELERLNRAYSSNKSEDNRLRLALFHALMPQGDRSRALSLLDVSPGEANGSGRNHPLATLLLPLLQERSKLDDVNSQTQQKLRDEQKRSEQLQQKLDAIRDIEKKMLERPVR
ncbi:MAG: hypothetical protein QM776_18070 [Rhodocyclaceae bacterium]